MIKKQILAAKACMQYFTELNLTASSVCAASIIRAYAVATVSFTDRTYAYASTLIWSAVEVNVGITCACLPVLQPVVQKLFGKILGSTHGSKYVGDSNRVLRGTKSSQNNNSGTGVIGGGPFRRLDEDLVKVQAHPPSNSTWVSATREGEREMRMNAIYVKKDVDLEGRVEVV